MELGLNPPNGLHQILEPKREPRISDRSTTQRLGEDEAAFGHRVLDHLETDAVLLGASAVAGPV
jgi:hypothetical protein